MNYEVPSHIFHTQTVANKLIFARYKEYMYNSLGILNNLLNTSDLKSNVHSVSLFERVVVRLN